MAEGLWEKSGGPRGLCPSDVSMTFDPTLSPTPTSIFLSVNQKIGVDRTFQVGYSIVVGGCPRRCGVFVSIPGLYRLDARSTRPPTPPPSGDDQKHLQTLSDVPWGTKSCLT